MTQPLVSVVLATRNGMDTLPAVVDAVKAQQTPFPFEIVAVDSSSTDGTEAFLRTCVDRFVSISAETFDHGLTRNLGIQYARGELVVLLVQDAEPASDRWLSALTAPVFADARLAGAFARQRPRREASALTRYFAARWVAAGERSYAVSFSTDEYERMPPAERLVRCAFDNVCSCVRRAVWEDHPFRATPIAEDVEWAREVLLAGWCLAYVPDAIVVHSHDRSVGYEFARTRALHARLAALFGLRTIPTVPLLARAVASSIPLHMRCAAADYFEPRTTARALALAVAWPLGQYFGGRDGVRETAEDVSPRSTRSTRRR